MNSTKTRLAASLLTLLASSRLSLSQDFSATSSLPQPSVDVVASTARPDDWLIDLDIDSDNNNGLGLPDGSVWEEEIEAHEFSIGKLVETGASRFTPVVIRLNQKALGKSGGRLPVLHHVRLAFSLDGARGRVRLWTKSDAPSGDESEQLVQSLDLYPLESLSFDTTTGVATIWIEAVEAAPGIATKVEIDQHGRPDMFLRATLVDGEQTELATDKVKYLPVDPGSFFPTFVDPANRPLRNCFPAILVNGPYRRIGTPHSIPSQESAAFGFRLATEKEFARLLKSSKLDENQKNYVADVLYYRIDTFKDPTRDGVRGFRVGLYRDFNSGDYTLAFQYSLKDDCMQYFMNLPARYFEQRSSGIYHRTAAEFLSRFLGAKKYDAPLPGLQLAGTGTGGDLAVFGALASGLHADTYNTSTFPEAMVKLILTRPDLDGKKRVERVPDSLDRLENANAFVKAYTIRDSPFRVEPAPFPISRLD